MGVLKSWISFFFTLSCISNHPSLASTFFAGCSPFPAEAGAASSSRARFWPPVDSEEEGVVVVVLAVCGGDLVLDVGSSAVAWTMGTPLYGSFWVSLVGFRGTWA